MKSNDYFKSALNDFASDIVAGDAIRSLAKKGMTVKEISENLTYPASIDMIKTTVWKYYISTGIIRFDKPSENDKQVKTEYVCERDRFGHSSYRRVETVVSNETRSYVACDFGRRIYQDKDGFMKSIEVLDKREREYILGLPWPFETVYHVRDERMKNIMDKML